MTQRMATDNIARQEDKARGRAAYWRFVPVAVILAGLAFGYLMGWQRYLSLDFLAESRDWLSAFVAAHPVAAPLGFAVLYTLAVAFSFPAASVLTVFAGFLFGWLAGGLIVAVAATAGATALFLACRSAVGDVLKKGVGGRAAQLAEGFERDAFSYLLVLRLAPVFPFFVVNIAPAFCAVPLRTYVAATFLGILPGTFAYAYLGHGLGSVLEAAAESGTRVQLADLVTPQITLAFAALAAVALLATVLRRLRAGRRPGS
ncbi:TVP38/TMEM64 family protein [Aquibium sp. A9E412]|uniref:TVP38/TMEM64 family protein n=1 Tax=Aquibium sp. A9E412 TaxID=2976767 RepID=UPI0025AFAD22|nr:TVP38/TMEM64 family protein [Aquibium sp. A9E412]MDN2568381.1 TVP38/TMEM64 family protein [Aquibium sp. A9E412]